jgi:4-hydroxy-3-methylbut-2-en-1-yl diphosphate synthase IspG/GcpE
MVGFFLGISYTEILIVAMIGVSVPVVLRLRRRWANQVACPYCGRFASSAAVSCPGCGRPTIDHP